VESAGERTHLHRIASSSCQFQQTPFRSTENPPDCDIQSSRSAVFAQRVPTQNPAPAGECKRTSDQI
jgi:hypothetical protein